MEQRLMYRPPTITQAEFSRRGRLESLARDHTETAFNTVISIMNGKDVPPQTRLKAAEILLNRGWGKPRETRVVEDVQGRSLMKLVHEIMHVTETQEMIDNEDVVIDYHA